METPTEKEYIAALEVVKKYRDAQTKLFNQKVEEAKKDLDVFFQTTYIKKYFIRTETSWNHSHRAEIHPTKPHFDEDYDGEFDDAIEAIGAKHGIELGIESGAYGK